MTAGAVAQEPPRRARPIVVDASGETSIHYVFVSSGADFHRRTGRIQDAFGEWPTGGGGSALLQTPLIQTVLTTRLDGLKAALQPGDELVIYYNGHGGEGQESGAPDTNADEPDGFDNHITNTDRFGETITDDELAGMISGFRESLTLTVILDSCFGGSFSSGTTDLQSATNAAGSAYGDHLAVIGPAGGIRSEIEKALKKGLKDRRGRPVADLDGDGTVTSADLMQYLQNEGALRSPNRAPKKCSVPNP